MNLIDRHNYEEYFILYMDNELSREERRMVEDFVVLHPDLKEELDILLHYKLEPDTSVSFPNKEDLMKVNGETPVTLTNYKEWLLLYTDNELSSHQKEMVEDFTAAHPEVKKELALLLKTRLQPEILSFSNKETLYRSAAKVRPLFGKWYRIAAAVLVFAAGLTTLLLINNKPGEEESTVAIKQKPVKNTNPGTQQTGITVTNSPDENSNPEKTQPKEIINNPVYRQSFPEKNNNTVTAAHTPQKQNIQPQPTENKNEVAQANTTDKKPDNNLPKPVYNPNVKKNENVIAINETPKNNDNNNILTGNPVTDATPQTSDIAQASFSEDGNDGKKNKLRGFLRKVTRTFEKRTNIDPANDDGKILVASFAIRTK